MELVNTEQISEEPYQWYAKTVDGKSVYIRYSFGVLRVRVCEEEGTNVINWPIVYDRKFANQSKYKITWEDIEKYIKPL